MSAAELTTDQIRRQLIPALRKLKGTGTLGDIVAAAGTPARPTSNLLNRLLAQWGGHLAVDERGELLYKFPPGLSPPFNWQEKLWVVAEWAYRVFKFLFKICIAVVLVVYFIVFLVIMIALIIAALAAMFKDSDGPSFEFGTDGGFPNIFVWFVGDWGSPAPRRHHHWERNQGLSAYKEKTRRPPLYETVFNYVFGEELPPVDPAAADREILGYIRDQKGVITATDLVTLNGFRYEEAERMATRLMVDYNGEPEVSENGTILYRFPQLIRSAGEGGEIRWQQWHYWWERPESPAVLNNNGALTNGVITGFNLFNLGWSGWFAFSPTATSVVADLFSLAAAPPSLGFALGWFPFLFSVVFFAVPLSRWAILRRENERRGARNRRRRILETIAQAARAGKMDLPAPTPNKEDLTEALLAYKGEVQIGERGEMFYRFEPMKRELADVQDARQAVKAGDTRLGQIVYDTQKPMLEQ